MGFPNQEFHDVSCFVALGNVAPNNPCDIYLHEKYIKVSHSCGEIDLATMDPYVVGSSDEVPLVLLGVVLRSRRSSTSWTLGLAGSSWWVPLLNSPFIWVNGEIDQCFFFGGGVFKTKTRIIDFIT